MGIIVVAVAVIYASVATHAFAASGRGSRHSHIAVINPDILCRWSEVIAFVAIAYGLAMTASLRATRR
jgi:hypothetical protein